MEIYGTFLGRIQFCSCDVPYENASNGVKLYLKSAFAVLVVTLTPLKVACVIRAHKTS